MRKLFLDIETIPAGEKLPPEEIPVPGNYSKPEAIAKYQQENVEVEFRKRAVITYKSRIICICWAFDDEPVQGLFIDSTDPNQDLAEHNLVYGFISRISGTEELRHDLLATEVIGHNVLFDLKTIVQRCYKYGIHCPGLTTLHAYSNRIVDTMKLFTLGDRQDLVSLDNVAKFLGLNETKSMKGSEVYDTYLNNEFDKILDYCKQDVNLTRTVYTHLNV